VADRADTASLDTERLSARYSDIDVWEPQEVLDAMIEGQFSAVAAVRAARPAILRAALAMEATLGKRGRLIYAGAGTSGRLAVQDGAELMPTFSWPPERLLLLIAGGASRRGRRGRNRARRRACAPARHWGERCADRRRSQRHHAIHSCEPAGGQAARCLDHRYREQSRNAAAR